jgi:fermentation-respiration switch protein FrsA (DUF1100 family)
MTLGRLGIALVAIAGGVVLAYWVFLFAVQRALIYPAPRAPDSGPLPGPDVERIWFDLPGARSEAWFLPAAAITSAAPLIVYAHGNGELIDGWLHEFAPLRAWGVSVLLVEYPGYGRSSGKPSQASIGRAFTAAYDWASRQPRVDARRIIGYGRSLGGGAICALASERSLAALVLESTFTSLRDQAHAYGAPGFLVRDPFDNLARVREFPGPILLLHGARDDSVPVEQARRLHDASPASELHVLACGHDDCPPPWPLLKDFLREQHLL